MDYRLPSIAVVLAVVSAPAATPVPTFTRPHSYPTRKGPRSVAIGDLNGDRKPDLAVVELFDGVVSVLLNRGDGTFRARRDYEPGHEARAVAIGDVNGDGRPDLVTANLDDTVSVLGNGGRGAFRVEASYATGDSTTALAIGDLNGDGAADLATASASAGAGSVSVLLNRGDGTFAARRDYPARLGAVSVAIGELNGDGKPDLATANEPDSASVLLNAGDDGFVHGADYTTGRQPSSVAVGDLNGDRRPDLVTANASAGTVSVFITRPNGQTAERVEYGTGGRDPQAVRIGDLNGDGKPDLVTANYAPGTVTVFVNGGAGTFERKRQYAAESAPDSVAIGDLNGDGRADLAVANDDAAVVSVLRNTTGLCAVPNVRGETLADARRAVARAGCRVGRIRRAYSTIVGKGHVISERPRPGTTLSRGGKVDLVVSRGARP